MDFNRRVRIIGYKVNPGDMDEEREKIGRALEASKKELEALETVKKKFDKVLERCCQNLMKIGRWINEIRNKIRKSIS